jgi:hypothetical protein
VAVSGNGQRNKSASGKSDLASFLGPGSRCGFLFGVFIFLKIIIVFKLALRLVKQKGTSIHGGALDNTFL